MLSSQALALDNSEHRSPNHGKEGSLLELEPGSICKVAGYTPDNRQKYRLLSMGIRPGIRVKLIQHSYPGLVLAVDNVRIALSKDLARQILVTSEA